MPSRNWLEGEFDLINTQNAGTVTQVASSQTYLLRYTSATANAKVTLAVEWYEET